MNSHKANKKSTHSAYVCRVCRKIHALKYCYRFRNMNITQRKEVVKKYGYCPNCLAHTHSQGSCFTKTGCGYCQKSHHSLLHMHDRLQKLSSPVVQRRTPRSAPKKPTTKSTTNCTRKPPTSIPTFDEKAATTSLTAILRQNAATLLPTAMVKIQTKDGKHNARCLLDSASKMSSISKQFIKQFDMTTLELDNETICPVTLWSCVDSGFKLDATLRVHSRINTTTPKESLPDNIKNHFDHLMLADPHFHKSSSVDIVIGVDIFSRIIREGIFIRTGLPTAQNTSFGIVIYGTFSI
ncbi:uncharacterized protein LOC142238082 [Haematobia irritans]|uniref:uncharacterized protein LOC142235686 n=1 Tax=Haematobia irritans TaxID=7368 RepID=UPI003F4FCD45